ncbi:hypothetical protein BD408DRAFT_423357 [Parasitella parasitica]|nr:hypothetical protein BD408DRAFT_423357 [Parasitella parasitica]
MRNIWSLRSWAFSDTFQSHQRHNQMANRNFKTIVLSSDIGLIAASPITTLTQDSQRLLTLRVS